MFRDWGIQKSGIPAAMCTMAIWALYREVCAKVDPIGAYCPWEIVSMGNWLQIKHMLVIPPSQWLGMMKSSSKLDIM